MRDRIAPVVELIEDRLHALLDPWLNPLDGLELGLGDDDLLD